MAMLASVLEQIQADKQTDVYLIKAKYDEAVRLLVAPWQMRVYILNYMLRLYICQKVIRKSLGKLCKIAYVALTS